jgi:hypothetical protein
VVVAEIVAAVVADIVVAVFVGVVEKLQLVVVVVAVTEEDSMYSLSTDLLVYNLVAAAVVHMLRIYLVGMLKQNSKHQR